MVILALLFDAFGVVVDALLITEEADGLLDVDPTEVERTLFGVVFVVDFVVAVLVTEDVEGLLDVGPADVDLFALLTEFDFVSVVGVLLPLEAGGATLVLIGVGLLKPAAGIRPLVVDKRADEVFDNREVPAPEKDVDRDLVVEVDVVLPTEASSGIDFELALAPSLVALVSRFVADETDKVEDEVDAVDGRCGVAFAS